MKYGKELATVLFATALGCGGKLLDMPDTGYAPLDGALAGDDGGGSDDGGGGSSSSGATSSTGGSSSSSGAGSSTGGGSSSSSSGSSVTSTCGGTVCSRSQVCCVSTMTGSQACTPTASCTGIALACADSTTCSSGTVCCFTATLGGGGGGGFGGSSSCKATCPSGGLTFQLCSTDSECPKGVTCQTTMFGQGKVCGGTGGAGGGGLGGLGGLGGNCAHPDTPIATPEGERPIASLHVGDVVLSVDHGQVRAVPLLRATSRPAPHHHVVSVILASGRVLHISEGHPTADGRLFRDLAPGDLLGNVPVVSLESIPYDADATYDILPASDTGTYFAAGALIGSTLQR